MVEARNVERPAQDSSLCPACDSCRWWISKYGVRICGVCHPPASPDFVARWEGEQDEQQAG
jgi:hypothetical protein